MMPKHCVIVGCDTENSEGYSLHTFPQDRDLHEKWNRGVKQQRKNWGGSSKYSLLCSKHFEPDCFGCRYRDKLGLLTKKCLKPDAVLTIFPRPIDGDSRPATPPPRLATEKRQCQVNNNSAQ